MPTTAAPWSLRYPVLTDTANVPRDLGYLAADTATALGLRNEIGYAEMLTQQYATSLIDVAGLTVTFVAGTLPISISLEAELSNSVATGETKAYIVLDGVTIGWMCTIPGAANQLIQENRTVRVTGLTAGSHTVKAQFASTSGGATASIRGAAGSPASLSVVTR